jgi:hypothetical protein
MDIIPKTTKKTPKLTSVKIVDVSDDFIKSFAKDWWSAHRVEILMMWIQGTHGNLPAAIRGYLSRAGLKTSWTDQRLGREIEALASAEVNA